MNGHKVAMLKELPLFGSCSADELRRVARLGDEIDVDAGTVLVREGSAPREFLVAIEGRAQVFSGRGGAGWVHSGDHYGERDLLSGEPHAARLVADTPMRILVFDRRTFTAMIEQAPSVAHKLLRQLAQEAEPARVAMGRPVPVPAG